MKVLKIFIPRFFFGVISLSKQFIKIWLFGSFGFALNFHGIFPSKYIKQMFQTLSLVSYQLSISMQILSVIGCFMRFPICHKNEREQQKKKKKIQQNENPEKNYLHIT